MSKLMNLFLRLCGLAPEVPSPRDIIKQSDIHYDQDKRLLQIFNLKPHIKLTDVKNTNSLDPVIDRGHTAILTDNFILDELQAGDIIVYKLEPKLIIHRIVKIEQDEKGKIFTLKGDNCFFCDPPVYGSQIKYLLIGIIY